MISAGTFQLKPTPPASNIKEPILGVGLTFRYHRC